MLEGSQDLRYLYAPWIPAHGDWLVARIADDEGIRFAPVRLFGCGDHAARRDLLSFAERRPDAVAAALSRRIAGVGGVAHGLLLTHDWPAPLRVLAEVGAAMGLPTVLAPHEAVYFSRDRYYRDAHGPLVAPICDHVLAWGALQRDVFLGRGVPARRIRVVGSPKLDAAARYAPRLGPAAARSALGLPPGARYALFAAQLLDNAVHPAAARRAQIAAIRDLAAATAADGVTLLVRPPPSGARLELGLNALADAPCALVDAAALDLPETAVHAALVASVGSTALLEAHLMGRPTLQIDYDAAATGAELRLAPMLAANSADVFAACRRLLRDEIVDDSAFRERLGKLFAPGTVGDGGATRRIADVLREVARPVILPRRRLRPPDPIARFAALRSVGLSRRLAARFA